MSDFSQNSWTILSIQLLEKLKNKIYILSFLTMGCDYDSLLNSNTIKPDSYSSPFRLYMDYEVDQNGFYHKTYPTGSTSSYGKVFVETLPIKRVFWSSPNMFETYYQEQWFSTPIIQYSTFSSSDGIGQQLFYIYEKFIGDTLTIIGGLSDNSWDYVQIIID